MTTNNYDPSLSLTPYFRDSDDKLPRARIWSIEKILADLAELGVLAFFEGPAGSDPTQLPGYSSSALWLKQSPGVQTAPGTLHSWNGSSPASSEANWPAVTPNEIPLTVTQATEAKAAAEAARDIAVAASEAVVDTDSGISFVMDGFGTPLATGLQGYIRCPFGGTIISASLLADQAGDMVVDIWKCTYAQFDAGATHPVAGDKITASAPPTLSAAVKSEDTALTGWTKAVTTGDIFAFSISSTSGVIRRATLSLGLTP